MGRKTYTAPGKGAGVADAPAPYVRATCFLLLALVGDKETPGLWLKLPLVLRACLREHQRALLAHAALKFLDPEVVNKIAWDVLRRAGWPQPPLLGLKDEAEFCAGLATRTELKVYADVISSNCLYASNTALRVSSG